MTVQSNKEVIDWLRQISAHSCSGSKECMACAAIELANRLEKSDKESDDSWSQYKQAMKELVYLKVQNERLYNLNRTYKNTIDLITHLDDIDLITDHCLRCQDKAKKLKEMS